jgi:phage tail-like protein
MPTAQKPYPYTSFRFHVEISGIVVAQVSEVSGLQIETETEAIEEGGENTFVYQLPKRTKFPRIILKRGITDLDEMWKWHQEVVSGKFQRKNGSIVLMDVAGNEKLRWNFSQAFPVKWSGPDFKAESNTVAFESIELAHHGIKKGT